MASVDESIAEAHDAIEQSSLHEELFDVIVQVQDELYDANGEVDLGGVSFPSANGGVTVDYICEGWEDPPAGPPDLLNGTMRLNMRLAAGGIVPFVWAEFDDCKYSAELGALRFDVLYRGAIGIYFDEVLSPTTNVYAQPVVFITRGSIVVEEVEFPVDRLFQVTFFFDGDGNFISGGARFDILVELDDGTSFVYTFGAELGQQLTDATGILRCNLEDRECVGPSRSFSW